MRQASHDNPQDDSEGRAGAPPGRRRLSPAERQRLITAHVSLVESVVGRIMVTLPDSVDREDLISCGILGLIQAVDRFEPRRGVKFNTYATSVIRGAVMDELRSQDWAPRSVREKCRRLERVLSGLEAQLGRSPDDHEMAAALRMPVDEYHQLLSDASGVALVSLETLLSGSDVMRQETTMSRSEEGLQDPEHHAERQELKAVLAEAIDTLPQPERLVIALYYHEELTLREIGEVLGVTESRVCQIHTQAVLRLRTRMSRELAS
ncbi:MAG: FliA/WhiG family RNA polymerase sigma factor [Armatimonadota bacterium]|jgi:RNA polymerase sigma factor for flagellar operon FliA